MKLTKQQLRDLARLANQDRRDTAMLNALGLLPNSTASHLGLLVGSTSAAAYAWLCGMRRRGLVFHKLHGNSALASRRTWRAA